MTTFNLSSEVELSILQKVLEIIKPILDRQGAPYIDWERGRGIRLTRLDDSEYGLQSLYIDQDLRFYLISPGTSLLRSRWAPTPPEHTLRDVYEKYGFSDIFRWLWRLTNTLRDSRFLDSSHHPVSSSVKTNVEDLAREKDEMIREIQELIQAHQLVSRYGERLTHVPANL